MRICLLLSSLWGFEKKKPKTECGFQDRRGDFSLCEALEKLLLQAPGLRHVSPEKSQAGAAALRQRAPIPCRWAGEAGDAQSQPSPAAKLHC